MLTDDRMAVSKIYEESWKFAYRASYLKSILIFREGVGYQVLIIHTVKR